MIGIVPIAAVAPSTYNPRQADPRRLDLVEPSLRKLGFVLPIYATPGLLRGDRPAGGCGIRRAKLI